MWALETGSQDWSNIAADEPGSILLQRAPSALCSGRSLLFRRPERVIEAKRPSEVRIAFEAVEEMLTKGCYVAGYVSYEAGFALESALADLAWTSPNEEPLLWFGCYRVPEIREDPLAIVPAASAVPPVHLRYSLEQEEYQLQVELVREMIASGETYQANLTMNAEWKTNELPAALFERLLRAQPVPYAALLHLKPDWHVLSLSPELFFERQDEVIRTRPMKGTASPGMDAAENRAQAEWLRTSEKDRAENVMIVDLLRSDLGRICQTGSIRVTGLFEVETYPTVLQMTSTVEGRLRKHVCFEEIFKALFPSGSIVGAPKIHTMRLLHALEKRHRGIYTGAIGYMAPENKAEFNVAIRTVSVRRGHACVGVGSGITFDSDPVLEYAECLTKTTFLHRDPEPGFHLIETLLLDKGSFTFLEDHLNRMAESAKYFGFAFDSDRARKALWGALLSWQGAEKARVRLILDRAGQVMCTSSKLMSDKGPFDLLLSGNPISANDRFLRHKTTNRALYDRGLAEAQAKGFADVLFHNTRLEITEGAIHNVIACVDGRWITPPLGSGVLPGIYRGHLLKQGEVLEGLLPLSDLLRAERIVVCNSVRGIRQITKIAEDRNNRSTPVTLWSHDEASVSTFPWERAMTAEP